MKNLYAITDSSSKPNFSEMQNSDRSTILLDDFSDYMLALTFFVPATGNVPTFISNASLVDIRKLAFFITYFLNKVKTAIALFEDEITYKFECDKLLSELSSSILPILNELNSVILENLKIVKNQNSRYQLYNEYFGISEVENMDILAWAKQDAKITYWMLLEFHEVRIDIFEIVNFLTSVSLRWAYILTKIKCQTNEYFENYNIPQILDYSIADPMLYDCRITTSFYRWFICHYDFAINAIFSKKAFDSALENLKNNDEQNASENITEAAEFIRASTVSMILGSMMPQKIYREYIRPSMGLGFTGSDNLHWYNFVCSKKLLLDEIKIFDSKLVLSALNNFQEKYMADIEGHVTVAAKMVGNKPSLTIEELNQDCNENEKNERPATSDLRNLHYVRLKEFEFLGNYPIINRLFK